MQSRINNPAVRVPTVPDALQAVSLVAKDDAEQAGPAQTTVNLVNLRASRINGCDACLDVPTRAAQPLTEVGTRLADQPDPVPDQVFDVAAKNYQEPALAALIVHITAIDFANRLNVISGHVAGAWTAQVAPL
ncbi:MAG: carboxymuconolactone decarboxylase family protein [Candidatus Dormiibacterota bacterium]